MTKKFSRKKKAQKLSKVTKRGEKRKRNLNQLEDRVREGSVAPTNQTAGDEYHR